MIQKFQKIDFRFQHGGSHCLKANNSPPEIIFLEPAVLRRRSPQFRINMKLGHLLTTDNDYVNQL